MLITVARGPAFAGAIIGDLFVDGQHECFTLEHEGREIPVGTYRVSLTLSNRFKRYLPILERVPGRTGIRIHAGNVAGDSDGCLLVGELRGVASVSASVAALGKLIAKMEPCLAGGETVSILIVGKPLTVLA